MRGPWRTESGHVPGDVLVEQLLDVLLDEEDVGKVREGGLLMSLVIVVRVAFAAVVRR